MADYKSLSSLDELIGTTCSHNFTEYCRVWDDHTTIF